MIKAYNAFQSDLLQIRAVLKKNELLSCMAIVFMTGILAYGYTFFSFTYNNDGALRTLKTVDSWTDGIEKGRWVYALLSQIYYAPVRLPFFHGILTVTILLLTSVFAWKIYVFKGLAERILSGAIFMSLPIFIHYFYYMGDSEVYSTGMLLSLLSLWCFLRGSAAGYGIAILLIIAALACYPALFSFITTAYLLIVLHRFIQERSIKDSAGLTIRALLAITSGLFLYFLITKSLVAFHDLELTSHREADQLTVKGLLLMFPFKLVWVARLFLLWLQQTSWLYQVYFGLAVLGIIFIIISKPKLHLAQRIAGGILIAAVFFSSLSVYLITYELRLYPGFQFGLILLSAILVVYPLRAFRGHFRLGFIVLSALLIVVNIRSCNMIALKYAFRLDAGQRIVNNILQDLLSHKYYEKQTTRVAIVGDLKGNSNYAFSDPYPQVKIYNTLKAAPVFFSNFDVPGMIKRQAELQGIDIELVSGEEHRTFQDYAVVHQMPDYPDTGSIIALDDILLLNLGKQKPEVGSSEKYIDIPGSSKLRAFILKKITPAEK